MESSKSIKQETVSVKRELYEFDEALQPFSAPVANMSQPQNVSRQVPYCGPRVPPAPFAHNPNEGHPILILYLIPAGHAEDPYPEQFALSDSESESEIDIPRRDIPLHDIPLHDIHFRDMPPEWRRRLGNCGLGNERILEQFRRHEQSRRLGNHASSNNPAEAGERPSRVNANSGGKLRLIISK
jgi:hypothetical protein